MQQMDPLSKRKRESAARAKTMFDRLNLPTMELNEYERIIATEIIHPDDIQVGFSDIGGLDDILESLQEAVIFPLTVPEYGSGSVGSGLIAPPKGVLLYGPPGCGKTLIAKALAKESGAIFINLHISTLTDKWYGESQKLVNGVFSLAKKLQPAIVFIDEIDSFMRERQSSDHELSGMMKAEFMTLWDGLSSTSQDRVLLLGATNRYHDIDKAILRRMPQRFAIDLPKEDQRLNILNILLKTVDISSKDKTLQKVAAATAGYSGSDLKELCRNAVMMPVRESIRKAKKDNPNVEVKRLSQQMDKTRPLKLQDFISNLQKENTQPSRQSIIFDLAQ